MVEKNINAWLKEWLNMNEGRPENEITNKWIKQMNK